MYVPIFHGSRLLLPGIAPHAVAGIGPTPVQRAEQPKTQPGAIFAESGHGFMDFSGLSSGSTRALQECVIWLCLGCNIEAWRIANVIP